MSSSQQPEPNERLRELRDLKGMTLHDVEKQSERSITASQLSNIENGFSQWKGIKLETIEGLARAFDMRLEDLISFVENRPIYDPNDKLEDFYKTVPTYHLTASASSAKGVLEKVADEETLLPDTHYLYELYKVFFDSEKQPRLRFVVRKTSRGVKAGHYIICELKDWGATVAKVRAVKGKEFALDDTLHNRSDIFKEKEIKILGILKAEMRLFAEPE